MSGTNPFRSGVYKHALALQRIFEGQEYVCSFPGTSQYSQGASSACGIVALNCVRRVLSLEKDGITGDDLLVRMLRKDLVEEIMSICDYWENDAHLELEEIYQTPFFEASLNLVCSDYGKPTALKFEGMLRQLVQIVNTSDTHGSCAVAITRPPEIIVCLKVVHPIQDIFVIFDSHARPKHPNGSAFIFNVSLEETALYLSRLLAFDADLLKSDNGLQWQAQLLANVSGHFFENAKNDLTMSPSAYNALLEANFGLLQLKTQESAWKSRYAALAMENERLEGQVNQLEEEKATWSRDAAASPLMRQRVRQRVRESPGILQNVTMRAIPGPISTKFFGSFGPPNSAHIVPLSTKSCIPFGSSKASQSRSLSRCQDSNSLQSSTPMKGKERESDFDIARRLQADYHEEDYLLRAQLRELERSAVQSTFECDICMDELPLDDIANLGICGHPFCRECIRQHITVKLDERRFPIPCPRCLTEVDVKEAGYITEDLVRQVGVSEASFSIFIELQLAGNSVPLYCTKCGRRAFVDKCDFDEMKILTCPFPNCAYLWCKECQKPVDFGSEGPAHSCDGSSELRYLMNENGWKHCPGCKTPTEKIEGCNHMTCCVPGCNVHFCYICGGLIGKSCLRVDVSKAVEKHYTKDCTLFDVPPEP